MVSFLQSMIFLWVVFFICKQIIHPRGIASVHKSEILIFVSLCFKTWQLCQISLKQSSTSRVSWFLHLTWLIWIKKGGKRMQKELHRVQGVSWKGQASLSISILCLVLQRDKASSEAKVKVMKYPEHFGLLGDEFDAEVQSWSHKSDP